MKKSYFNLKRTSSSSSAISQYIYAQLLIVSERSIRTFCSCVEMCQISCVIYMCVSKVSGSSSPPPVWHNVWHTQLHAPVGLSGSGGILLPATSFLNRRRPRHLPTSRFGQVLTMASISCGGKRQQQWAFFARSRAKWGMNKKRDLLRVGPRHPFYP